VYPWPAQSGARAAVPTKNVFFDLIRRWQLLLEDREDIWGLASHLSLLIADCVGALPRRDITVSIHHNFLAAIDQSLCMALVSKLLTALIVKSAPVVPTAKVFAEAVEGLVERGIAVHCVRERNPAIVARPARIFHGGEIASLYSERGACHVTARPCFRKKPEERFDLFMR
jgi:hypothetical protein